METFATRIQDLVGATVTDNNALTEWLTEEAVNAIDIMRPEMLVSASSTHRLLVSEDFNTTGRVLNGAKDADDTDILLNAGSLTSTANCKVGATIAILYQANYLPERMIVTAITGSPITLTVVIASAEISITSASIFAASIDIAISSVSSLSILNAIPPPDEPCSTSSKAVGTSTPIPTLPPDVKIA